MMVYDGDADAIVWNGVAVGREEVLRKIMALFHDGMPRIFRDGGEEWEMDALTPPLGDGEAEE